MGLRVLHAVAGSDTGGNCWGITQAFRRHPQPGIDTVRSAVRSTNYIDYPRDLPWEKVHGEWARADVVHLHNNFSSPSRTRPHLDLDGKRIVVTYHGTGFRQHPEGLLREQRRMGAVGTVSTLDLWLLRPTELAWLPSTHDMAHLAALRAAALEERPDGPLRIAHAPTHRGIKSTDAFLAACQGLPVEVVLIERRTWADTLTIKATCDVFYDQVQLGYGNNTIEAWGMGIPVIAGAAEPTLAEYRRRFGHVPFVEATEQTLRAAIERLLDPGERAHWGEVGRVHAHRWHDAYPAQVAAAIYRGEQPGQSASPARTLPRRPRIDAGRAAVLDVVYPVKRTTDDNAELRHSLRSVAANVDHGRVWLLGDRVPWARDVTTLPRPQEGTDQYAKVRGHLSMLLRHPDCPARFVLFNDDFFRLDRHDGWAMVHRGPLEPIVKAYAPRNTRFAQALAGSLDMLRRMGIDDPLCYENHEPMVVDRDVLRLVLDRFEQRREPYAWRSIVGNVAQVGGAQVPDVKVYDADTVPAGGWVSTSPASWAGKAGDLIRARFAEPSPYERP